MRLMVVPTGGQGEHDTTTLHLELAAVCFSVAYSDCKFKGEGLQNQVQTNSLLPVVRRIVHLHP